MFWDGKWFEEEDLGGNLESAPAATAIQGEDIIHTAVCLVDGKPYTQSFDEKWNGFEEINDNGFIGDN